MLKINIFKDTVELKEANSLPKMLLFVLDKFPDVNLKMAYFIAQNKVNEVNHYKLIQGEQNERLQ